MANPANLTVNACVANGSIAQPAAQTIDTNGNVSIAAGHSMDRMIVELVNAAANAITVTVKAGDRPPAMGARDLALTLSATGGGSDKKIFGPFESGRFVKSDGTIQFNFQAATGSPNLTVRVYKLPKQL